MSQRQIMSESETAALRLPVPERDVIITSRHVADPTWQDRVRQTPSREPVLFTFDELEDLRRGLTVDAEQSDDKKRRKTLSKILDKIDEFLDEEDDDYLDSFFDDEDFEPPVPASPQEMFAQIFGPGSGPPLLAAPTCRVMLGKIERETLAAMDTVPGDVHKMLAIVPREEQAFDFSPRQLLVTSLAVQEAIQLSVDEASRQQLTAIAQRISDGLFAAMKEGADLETVDRYRQSQGPQATIAFQLKITLEGSKPPIWRRIQVADCTLDVLHEIIQFAMGWDNDHMHLFEWGENQFSHPDAELDEDDFDETQAHLSQLVADGCQKLRYWYDFGDDWWHTITIEKTLDPKPTNHFPVCLKGVGACPPEDCGGICGYYEFLEAIRDPKHERHDELVEWAGDDFDPEYFDLDEVNTALAW